MSRSAMRYTLRRAAPLALAATLAAHSVAADGHEEAAPEWDQEQVTALAEKLAEAAANLFREVSRNRGQEQIGSGQARAREQFRDDLRTARDTSRNLARALGNGQSREQTTPVYRRLMMLVRNARETARRLMIEKPELEHVATANAALDALAPFYPDVRPG